METLLKPENKAKLVDILKNCMLLPVVSTLATLLQLVPRRRCKAWQSRSEVRDQVARVNDSKLVATDIDASNGVIHVIDAVLLPSDNKRAEHILAT